MSKDYASYYNQLCKLIATAPAFDSSNFTNLITSEGRLWLGRVSALVKHGESLNDELDFRKAMDNIYLGGHGRSYDRIWDIIFRTLANFELNSTGSVTGTFVPARNVFDAYVALKKILSNAQTEVLIVDPYLDETVLEEYAVTIPDGVQINLLMDGINLPKFPGLTPAAKKWMAQHGANKALELRFAPAKSIHDRAIFVDSLEVWTITQSIKDFAKRSPGEIIKITDPEMTKLKIEAYVDIWNRSTTTPP